MHFHRLSVALFACVACASCKREAPEPAVSRATPAVPPASKQTQALEPSSDVSPIVQRLAWEAENRPKRGVTVEQVFEALDRAGIAVTGTRQYLGVTVQASYCAGGVAADGVAISVCEYPTAKAADASRRFMEQRFAAMTSRTRRVVHGQALLTIAQPAPEHGADIASRATQTFRTLQSEQH